MKNLYFIGFLIILLLIAQRACQKDEESYPEDFLKVKFIADGDTFWLDDGSQEGLKVRLIGINAPEAHEYMDRDEEYYGKEAEEYLKKMVAGKKVRLEYDIEKTDRYDRTLAYAFLEDGTFINAELVKNGYAVVMTISPNVKYSLKFAALQTESRLKKRGMWAQRTETTE